MDRIVLMDRILFLMDRILFLMNRILFLMNRIFFLMDRILFFLMDRIFFVGSWNMVIGSKREKQQKMKLSLLASLSSEVEGVMTSSEHGNADIPLDKKESYCHGSNLHMVGKYEAKKLTYIFDCKVAADGNSFAGL